MNLTKIASILHDIGIQASAGKHTMIIRDINTDLAMCEFTESDDHITVKVWRLDASAEYRINPKFRDFELLDLIIDVAGGIA